MRRLLTLILILCLAAPARPASQVVVLVVRADSPVQQLDSVTVRKLYLGLPVLANGNGPLLHPLRNRSDGDIDLIFFQQIVAMTPENYDRQILNRVNQQGSVRPTEFTSVDKLTAALMADPNSVSFMWDRDVGHNPQIRVIRVLWSD